MTTEIEWRRRWKPDLKSRPWKPFTVDDKNYLIKYLFQDNAYEILISDFTSIWQESLAENDIERRAKGLNPNVEAPLSKLLEHISENLESQKKGTKYSLLIREGEDAVEQSLRLTLNTKLAGLPFVWRFNARLTGNDVISTHLTLPMIAVISELTRRQQELFKLLANKDKEIDDYKTQGVKVSRRHLETPVFDSTNFTNNMITSKAFEECIRQVEQTAFSTEGQELYSDVMMKYAWIHHTPHQALEGESLMDEGGMEPPDGAPVGATGQSWANRVPISLVQGTRSPGVSPKKSPAKSPGKEGGSTESSPVKDTELLRRQALERKLQEEEQKLEQKAKKKKKMKF